MKHIFTQPQALIFIATMAIGIGIGGHMAEWIFFGVITLLGMVTMVENIKSLKWFVFKTNKIIDVLIFIASLIATAKLGVTITASLTVAGLGYTMVYAPYIRNTMVKKKAKDLKPQERTW